MREAAAPLILLLLCLDAATAHADTYYVSPDGRDASPGTQGQPWQTINHALTSRSPGDIVILQAGATFVENVAFAAGGAAGSPVTLTSDPVNRATISQALASRSGLSIYNQGHIAIENIVLVGVGRSSTRKAGIEAYADDGQYSGLTIRNVAVSEFYRGITIMGYGAPSYGFADILIDRCRAEYNLDAGALTWAQAAGGIRNLIVRDSEFNHNYGDPGSAQNSGNGFSAGSIVGGLFERCLTHDNGGAGNATEGPVGIMVYDSRQVTIQFCESYRNQARHQDGDGFDLDLGTSDSVIQYCYSHDNYGAGYLLSTDGALTSWARNVVRYNISENDGTGGKLGGLHFYSPGTVAPLTDSQVYGNTIYSSVGPAVWFYSFASMSGVEIRNNIFVTANNQPLVKYEVSPSPTTAQARFQGNAYWSSGGPFDVAGHSSLAAWRAARGQELLDGLPVGFEVDPLLDDAGNGGTIGDPHRLNLLTAYRLQQLSPLIDAGLDLLARFAIDPGPIDFFEHTIPQGDGHDVGAAEFVGSSSGTDAGPAADAGARPDAGIDASARDNWQPVDTGTARDAWQPQDAATVSDAWQQQDSATARDVGQAQDGPSSADAATRPEAGADAPARDAGAPVDAATSAGVAAGCGCATRAPRPGDGVPVGIIAAAWLWRRRLRR